MGYSVVQCSQFFSSQCSAKDCVASGDIVYLSNVSAKDVAIEETWRLIGSVLAQAAGRLSNAAVR